MKKYRQSILFSYLFIVLGLCFSGCAITEEVNNKTDEPAGVPYAGKDNAVTLMSNKGLYRFRLYSTKSEIPLRKIHEWIVHVETKDGVPVDDAKLFVFGGMPAHRHGFPTKPLVKENLGNGDYRVEGIKFNMPGAWQMRFNLAHKRVRDRVIFDINLK